MPIFLPTIPKMACFVHLIIIQTWHVRSPKVVWVFAFVQLITSSDRYFTNMYLAFMLIRNFNFKKNSID